MSRNSPHRGFTLVEMLVAVTLVLLMMSMFAQIFQIAGGAITKQRGIAENDQKTRTFQTVLKADLDKRTFRLVMPWAAGEDGAQAEASAPDRTGYLYISENDPLSDLDDLLQFTTNVTIVTKNRSTDPYYGKATLLPGTTLYTQPNQPEADDSRPDANGAGQSTAAEVSYFVRGKNLYRRVLLIREPLKLTNAADQPRFGTNRDAFDWNDTAGSPDTYPQYNGIGGNSTFWNDFDYSAYQFPAGSTGHARFHGLKDLDNASTVTQFPLANPRYRFGFHPFTAHSREWASNQMFLGRYTHEETSRETFNYPQSLSAIGDPMSSAVTVNMDPDFYYVTTFANGPRRGEDLILANVHSFDIKVWDDAVVVNGDRGGFVDLGHSSGSGYYRFGANQHRTAGIDFGPDLSASADSDRDGDDFDNRVFDTWHPAVSADFNKDGTVGGGESNVAPPYRAILYNPVTSGATYQDYETWVAAPDTTSPSRYSVGSKVFPQAGYPALASQRLYYVCVASDATVSGAVGIVNHGVSNPTWPRTAGSRVLDGDLVWEAVDNWKPLRALQITVRFLDVTSGQMRQSTLVHSLID